MLNDTVSILNNINLNGLKTIGIVTGSASSSAFMLLQACDVRLAYHTTIFCLHCGVYTPSTTAPTLTTLIVCLRRLPYINSTTHRAWIIPGT